MRHVSTVLPHQQHGGTRPLTTISHLRRAIQEAPDLSLPVFVQVDGTLFPISEVVVENDGAHILVDTQPEAQEEPIGPAIGSGAGPEPAGHETPSE